MSHQLGPAQASLAGQRDGIYSRLASYKTSDLEEMGARLPAILRNQAVPARDVEWLEFAQVCSLKEQYAAAVCLYAAAFTRNEAARYRYAAVRDAPLPKQK